MSQRKKKAIEYHFVDMNDPDRYKKLKVARACDFCRRRKSKCDIGIPDSGTCSNCKKANHICIFSPVSSPSKTNAAVAITTVPEQQHIYYSNNISHEPQPALNSDFISIYQDKFPFLSMDQKAHCGYEIDDIYAHMTLVSTTSMHNNGEDIPVYSEKTEQELFNTYFSYIHPFYPILDRYYILQSLRFDSDSLPCSLKWAVMAITLSHFSNRLEDSNNIAALYYQHALNQLDHTPCLSTVQTLFLLYKYREMTTPVGTPVSSATIGYLKEAQSIIVQLQQQSQNQWTVNDEFICRSSWILFITLAMSNTADERWKNMLECCVTPTQLPSLTETEQYDKNELNITCNLIHLINIALLYSQTICLISDQNTLFDINHQHISEFNKLATRLEVWTSTLPSHITLSLSADTPSLYCTQNDNSKNSSFIMYLCLIYDILDLLVSIHQPIQQHDLSKKAIAICFRAHSLTVGGVQAPQFSILASIQGSRLVSFGLTLALQAQSFYHSHHLEQTQSIENIKKYYLCCSLSFQIFGQISLSPQLYMTIQTIQNQIESKNQLQQLQLQDQQKQQQRPINFILQQHSSSNSSNSNSNHGLDSSASSSSSSLASSFTVAAAMDSSASYFYNNNQQQQMGTPQQGAGGSGGWQQYTSYNNTTNSNNYQHASYCYNQSSRREDTYYNMPVTPTFEMNQKNMPYYSTSPLIVVDSYFQPQEQINNFGSSVMVSAGPYNFINNQHSFEIYDSKSCRNKKMII